MKKSAILLLILCVGPSPARGNDFLQPIPAGAVQFDGWLAKRLKRTEKKCAHCARWTGSTRQFTGKPSGPVRPGKRTTGAQDFVGRWLDATSAMESYGMAGFDQVPVMRSLLKFQQPDGHIGISKTANSHWGDGRGLIGLVGMAAHGNNEALAAAKKLAAHYRDCLEKTDWRDWATTEAAGLEGLVALYRLTKDPKDLALAEGIADRGMKIGWLGYMPNHSHSLLTFHRGLMDLAEVTGKLYYLIRCEDHWEHIARNHAFYNGCYPEVTPSRGNNEGCATADWLRLNLKLWRLTRNVRYLDTAERTVFNGLPFEQMADGSFGAGRTLMGGVTSPCDFCCTHHCALAMIDLAQNIYTLKTPTFKIVGTDKTVPPMWPVLYVSFFVPSRATVALPDGKQVSVTLIGDYPAGESVRLAIEAKTSAELELRLRIPPSAHEEGLLEMTLNGKPLPADIDGEFVVIRPPSGKWQAGDRLAWRMPGAVARCTGEVHSRNRLRGRDVLAWPTAAGRQRCQATAAGDGQGGGRKRGLFV